MARVEKYTRSACGHLFKHYERARNESGDYIKFGNTDIDTTKSHLNYNLAPDRGMSQIDYIKKRVEVDGVKLQNRKDVNLMCCWVVTLPKDFQGEERDFFQAAYEFMAKRYGEENVISAYVHVDEKQPHMHFSFCPITKDERRGGYKVSAKEVLTRQELREFHGDLQQYLDDRGIECSVLNGATREGNKAVVELKRESAIQTLREIEEFKGTKEQFDKEYNEFVDTREDFNKRMQEMNAKVQRFYAYQKQVEDEFDARVANAIQEGIAIERERCRILQNYLKTVLSKATKDCKEVLNSSMFNIFPIESQKDYKRLDQKLKEYTEELKVKIASIQDMEIGDR